MIAATTASALLPVWFTILVFAASAGKEDAPSEGMPVMIAIVVILALPYGLLCGSIGCPILGRLFRIDAHRCSAFFAAGFAIISVSVLIASSFLGLDRLGLTKAWQMIPYLAAMMFAPPFAAGFIAYCLTRVQNVGHKSGG
ncbi:hypothetical protein [Rubripirellula lacrimiformis]|nr:hypothetical protein [Rubripirellula lacrimiformis]